ncbi:ATP-binding protein [Proteinivorax hydrogeniformans]|uniref:Oxygen sensor histidine kinase NreB n=1 Tax=Proteinivorax hydrogeniformans TaxID=1826727 RepID=A0AAU8HV79_9FIRM
MQDFFLKFYSEIYFIYGLSFIIMGFAITLQVKEYSNKTFSKNLWLLAMFGFLHGLNEWTHFYIPARFEDFAPTTIFILDVISLNLVGISFAFLLAFSLSFLYELKQKNLFKKLIHLSIVGIIIWVCYFVIYRVIIVGENLHYWYSLAETINRYFFAFPAGIIGAYAINYHKKQIQKSNNSHMVFIYTFLTISFLGYGIFAGVFVPPAHFFPATWLNYQSFFQVTGIPVPLFRTLFSILITINTIIILRNFQLENISLMGRTINENAILQERERIKKDIHDDIIQGIYSVSLRIQSCKADLDDKNDSLADRLDSSIDQLNNTITDLRLYIQGLKTAELAPLTISEIMQQLYEKFKSHLTINIDNKLKPFTKISPEIKTCIYSIVGELLINVLKHSKTDVVNIKLENLNSNAIKLSVEDNGVGINIDNLEQKQKGKEGMGLIHVRQRVESLGGSYTFVSEENKGTKIIVQFPLKGGA